MNWLFDFVLYVALVKRISSKIRVVFFPQLKSVLFNPFYYVTLNHPFIAVSPMFPESYDPQARTNEFDFDLETHDLG